MSSVNIEFELKYDNQKHLMGIVMNTKIGKDADFKCIANRSSLNEQTMPCNCFRVEVSLSNVRRKYDKGRETRIADTSNLFYVRVKG